MPANHNARGGKGYKKGKKGGVERVITFATRTEGQDYARVIRILGDRRVSLYCNDGIERICKIRGALCRGPKKQIIGVGDIVLFSLRSFDDGSDYELDGKAPGGLRTKTGDIGDIILKYETSQWRQLRKETGINQNLFSGGEAENMDDGPALFMSENADDEQEKVEAGHSDANADVDIDAI
jgi:translation initiation factor 1A